MSSNVSPSPRFIVIAPLGRDAELICGLLNSSGYAAECLHSLGDLQQDNTQGVLGLILTDEAVVRDGIQAVRAIVDSQPAWSDLPVILLTSGPREPRYAMFARQMRMEIGNLIMLDRPARKELLLSATQVAYNSRMKQFEVRDAADRQVRSDEALRNSEKLAAAGRLTATLAHEIVNPLEALGNLLYLVENSPTLEEARSYGRTASQELGRVTEIVNHTLRFHRAPANPGLTDLGELTASAFALFRGKMRERHIHESLDARAALAYCSAGEIRQAVVNLIGNALDAMPEGGNLHVRVSMVTLDANRYARVTIADTGSGIREEIRPNLFTQFFTTKGSRGTGLGLWLTREIIRRNHGRLRFRSRVHAPTGTVFSIYLPSSPSPSAVQPGDSAKAA